MTSLRPVPGWAPAAAKTQPTQPDEGHLMSKQTTLYAPDGREMGRLEGVAEWDDPAAADFIRACLASGAGG